MTMRHLEPYQGRMIIEYSQAKERYKRLDAFLWRYEQHPNEYKLGCPEELLREQLDVMKRYVEILEKRAEIENIPLEGMEQK